MNADMDAPAETPYMETEMLLAVMREDADTAQELIDSMLPDERAALQEHLGEAARLLFRTRLTLGEAS